MPQWEGGATYDQIWKKKEVAEVHMYVITSTDLCYCERVIGRIELS